MQEILCTFVWEYNFGSPTSGNDEAYGKAYEYMRNIVGVQDFEDVMHHIQLRCGVGIRV